MEKRSGFIEQTTPAPLVITIIEADTMNYIMAHIWIIFQFSPELELRQTIVENNLPLDVAIFW